MKKFLRWLFDFYLFGNIHIAVCAVALLLCTKLFFGMELRRELLVFVFNGTFFLYSLQRIPAAFGGEKVERRFRRHHWNIEHKYALAALCVIAAVLSGWSFFRLYLRSQLVAMVPAFLSFIYAFPVVPSRK
ncbi:MAG TPA: hypothetical protein VFU15_02690, partial [Bacteroidia bacterium]|nr:hypothetical protein [Bacteroidia bacterium]